LPRKFAEEKHFGKIRQQKNRRSATGDKVAVSEELFLLQEWRGSRGQELTKRYF